MEDIYRKDNDDDALFELAQQYDEAEEYEKSLPIYVELANKGHAEAQNELGLFYEMGDAGVEIDVEKAFEWYMKSAKQGCAEAMVNLGDLYSSGNLSSGKDIDKAFDWYMKSASQDNADAMVKLGDLYNYGRLPEGQNLVKAVGWYEKAKELGAFEAICRIGSLYQDGQYFEKDLQKAIDCYFEALECAEEDDKRLPAFYLGLAFEETKEYEKSFEYLKQAADLGEDLAYLVLGESYELGRGVEKDYNKAFDYFSKAYDKGVKSAGYFLGEAYYYGRGTTVNYEKALQLLEEDAEKGNTYAMLNLGEMYYSGKGCEKNKENEEKALALYKQAAESGNEEGKRIMEILQPFFIDESPLIDKLTDKLIEVAQKPSLRKEFSVTYDAGGGHLSTVVFHKNMPPMFAMEQFFMTAYYVEKFEWMASLEYIPDKTIPIIIDKTAPWIKPVADKELRLRFHRSQMEIYSKIGSEKGVEHHRAEYEKWEQMEAKPYRVKNDTFEYWYAEAEKRDWEAMIIVSVCYYHGIVARENARLGELWKQLARSTRNYYEPNGRPFEEVYAKKETELTQDDSSESSTN